MSADATLELARKHLELAVEIADSGSRTPVQLQVGQLHSDLAATLLRMYELELGANVELELHGVERLNALQALSTIKSIVEQTGDLTIFGKLEAIKEVLRDTPPN